VTAVPCQECRTLLGGYVLGALEPGESVVVERHLAACSNCAGEHAQLRALPALLDLAGHDDAVPVVAPGALEEAVLDGVGRDHRSPKPRPPRTRLRRVSSLLLRPLPAAGALAAAAIALGVILATGGAPVTDAEAYHATLGAVPGARGATASARLASFRQGTHVDLEVSGLRGIPGAIYELWCVRDDGEKVSAGTFRVDRSGHADVALTTAAMPEDYHWLTIERRRISAARSSGERVMSGTVRED
jgi:anti-sigma-K factor RskA